LPPHLPLIDAPIQRLRRDRYNHNRALAINNSSTQINRGTDQSPFIVKTIPPEKSQNDIQREKEKTELDLKTVQLTGDLVSYTKSLLSG
jgi:hypothetical protein